MGPALGTSHASPVPDGEGQGGDEHHDRVGRGEQPSLHLHGHTYQLGASGSRKDTSIVLPKKKLSVVFDADNPGQWMLHCHNSYHAEVGMMALVAYEA